MKAVQFSQIGGPEVFEYVDVPDPVPGPGEALIQLKAIGVNYTDIYTRSGVAYPASLPAITGSEGAGVVTAVGEGVTEVKVGDAVVTYGTPRCYAELVVAPAWRLVPLPAGLSFEQGAAALLQGMTAQYLADDSHAIKPGDVALVHAGAGGVGQLLIQMAKARGATVITTVSSDAKAAICKGLGADHVIIYTRDDFEAETMRLTDGKGVDVVYDSVGKDTFLKGMNVLKQRAIMVAYGQSSGWPDPVPLQVLNRKSNFVQRPTLQSYTMTREEIVTRSGIVFGEMLAGKLKLEVTETFPLAQAADAHRRLESRATTGKLLLIP